MTDSRLDGLEAQYGPFSDAFFEADFPHSHGHELTSGKVATGSHPGHFIYPSE